MRFDQGKGGGGESGNTYVSAMYMTADATIAVNNIAAGLDAATAAWASGACDTPGRGGGGEGSQGAALHRTGQMHKMDTANAV